MPDENVIELRPYLTARQILENIRTFTSNLEKLDDDRLDALLYNVKHHITLEQQKVSPNNIFIRDLTSIKLQLEAEIGRRKGGPDDAA